MDRRSGRRPPDIGPFTKEDGEVVIDDRGRRVA
jgi:hypothetical protein